MATRDLLTTVQTILQAAVTTAALTPAPVVKVGIPQTLDGNAVLYLFHNGYSDVTKANDLVMRKHEIGIHLALLEPDKPDVTELAMADFSDVIAGAFYTNRMLSGTAQTSELHQNDGAFTRAAQASALTVVEGGTYRQRWWSLEVDTYHSYAMA